MRYAHIVGWGKHTPDRVMANEELATLVDTSDAWIRERTGIGQRHMAGPKDTCTSLAAAAALEALDVANITAAQVGLIIVATSTPDYTFPATACLVQDALGADNAGAFDLSAACSGFVYALSMAADAIKAGSVDYALVIGADLMSRIVDWKDRGTCVLFGDGAGAVVLQASDQPGGLLTSVLRADGSGGDMLYVRNSYRDNPVMMMPHMTATPTPAPAEGRLSEVGYIYMNGREVYRFGARILAGATREVSAKAGWEIDDIDLVIPHQANSRIIDAAAKSLSMSMDKFFCNIEYYGNTSAASIPIAICDAVNSGRLRPNDKLVMVGFGAGLTWASAAMQWGTPRVLSRTNRTLNRVRIGLANVRSRARRVFRRVEDNLLGNGENHVKPQPAPNHNGASAPEAETEHDSRA
ncbi:MAG TPA: beta-ketoacyl-ACP synthase III [Anaerolineae bacterium]|jgi:3-oxoacyl-[acyl-carrier-protein] synthase-3